MADRKILVIGTGNADKIREIQALFDDAGLEIDARSVKEYDPEFDPVEDADTLAENALIKAREAARVSDQWAIADDTGLFIDALGGAPGVFSARYAGPDATYASNRKKVLDELEGIPDEKRTARFRTVVAFVFDGNEVIVEGSVEGKMTTEERGELGFGYDSIFYCDELGMTFAEADMELKASVSHRGRAIRAFIEELKRRI